MQTQAVAEPATPEPCAVERLISLYGGRVPRYTSYPTAVQFTPSVDATLYARWLADLSPTVGPLSIYVHIPFCDNMCWYCGCHTAVVNQRGPIEDYVSRLLTEIELAAAALPQRLTIGSIHFGGGTPNMLAPHEIAAILGKLKALFDWSAHAEIAAEIDPRLLTGDWVAAAAGAGMNRASLGAQDFDADVQAAINRAQPYESVAAAARMLRVAGIVSLNMDLMYGLPRQTMASLEETIGQALRIAPDRLSLFGYAHVPWLKAHQKLIDEQELPGPELRYRMQRRAADLLEAAGWRRLGLDHFAKPEDSLSAAADAQKMKRNFQGYTTDEAQVLIGFGASSIGRLPQGYVQNEASVPRWREKIAAGRLPTARGVALDDDDRFRADVIERLMCDFSVDLGEVCARHERALDALAPEREALEPMARDGLIETKGDRIEVTRLGRDFVRSVCAVFDRHLERGATRHSAGV